jgi:hypothetical protein
MASSAPAISTAVTVQDSPPTVAAPPLTTAYEDVDQAISGITVDDPDGDNLTVTLGVSQGTLTLGTTSGLTFSAGDGTADSTMEFSGTIAALNTALASLVYRGSLNYYGGDTLKITVSDGSLSSNGSVVITVKSAAQQAADLTAQVKAYQKAGFLTAKQANSLLATLALQGNSGDIGKIGSFINQVNGFVNDRTLTQTQASSLLGPANILLLSVSRG